MFPTIKTTTLALFTILILAASASAQTDVVATNLQATTEDPTLPAEGWAGTPVTGRVSVDFCWGAEGGANPAGGSITLTPSATAPDWVTVTITPESIAFSPPSGPTTEAGCESAGAFDVAISAPDGTESGQTEVGIAISAAPAGADETLPAPLPLPPTGTFANPSGASASFILPIAPATGTAPAGGSGGSGGSGDGAGGATDDDPAETADSPAPGFALLGMLAVAVVVVARRR